MTISTISGLNNALKDRQVYYKTMARSAIGTIFMTMWDATGTPGAGTLAVGNTANGVVPTDTTTGALGSASTGINLAATPGYLTAIEICNLGTTQSRFVFYDRLFHAGAYAFNSSVTLASQPSYAARIPNSDYTGTQIWIENVTTITGSLSLAVTYTNQSGTTGRTTGTYVLGTPSIGMLQQMPLQSGDSGVQKIESVTGSVATVGTFNVLVIRPLSQHHTVWDTGSLWIEPMNRKTLTTLGMPTVFTDSCIAGMYYAASTVNPCVLEASLEISS